MVHPEVPNATRLLQVAAIVLTIGLLASAGVGTAAAQVAVTNGTVFVAGDGPTVEITENLTLDSPYDYPDAHTVDLVPNASFRSNGTTTVTVDSIDGQWTNLTTHTVSAGLTVDPADKQTVTIAGANVSSVAFQDVDSQSAGVDLVYNATDPVTVTITDLPSGTAVDAVAVGGSQLDDTTSNADGNATFVLPAGDNQRVDIRDPSAFTSNDGPRRSGGGGASTDNDDDSSETISVPVTATDEGSTSTVGVTVNDEGRISLEFTAEDGTDEAEGETAESESDDATDGSDDSVDDEITPRAELRRLDIQTDGEASGEVTVQQTETPEEISSERVEPLESSTGREAASYISVTTDFDDQVESATFEVSVPAERFDGREAADATVYHYVDGEWTPLETDLVDDSGEAYTFEATTNGFSTFAVGITPGEDSEANEPPTETNASTTGPNESGKQSTDETPGFGVAVAVVALLMAAAGAHRAT